MWKIIVFLVVGSIALSALGSALTSCEKRKADEVSTIAETKREADEREAREALIREFTADKQRIMERLNSLASAKKWTEARDLAWRFRDVSDPDYVRLAAKIHTEWQPLENKRIQAEKVEIEKAEKAHRKSQGPSIGMTFEHALETSWGKPKRANSTTTKSGKTWQLVYERGYVYIDESGKVRAVQERY